MLDGARDEVPASGDLEGLGDAADGKIVGLGSAAREHDLGDLGLQQVGHRRPRVVEDALGPLTEMMDARRVAELLAENARHGLEDGGVDRRRGVVVEVDAHR